MLTVVCQTDVLRRIDGSGYKAYHDLRGCWEFDEMSLFVDYAQAICLPALAAVDSRCTQSDPFAMPSRIRVRVPMDRAAFPAASFNTKIRRVALCDYITRVFHGMVSSGAAAVCLLCCGLLCLSIT